MGSGRIERTRVGLLCITVLVFGSSLAGAERADEAEAPSGRPATWPMEVRNPPGVGTVETDVLDAAGGVVGVSCATCHDPEHPDALAMQERVPKDFHAALEVRHGSLRCASCHAPDDRTRLRLADGETLAITEALLLCGQCHGSQRRDFEHGAHGGGRGYWDDTRGAWVRNACIACHDPHAPEYPRVMPAPPPNDRFLPQPATATGNEEVTAHE